MCSWKAQNIYVHKEVPNMDPKLIPSQESNLSLLHCRQILYHLSHHGRLINCVCVCVLVAQPCLPLRELMESSPPCSSLHGILQARILEWVAIPFFRGSSWPRDQTWVSCIAGRFWANSDFHKKLPAWVMMSPFYILKQRASCRFMVI